MINEFFFHSYTLSIHAEITDQAHPLIHVLNAHSFVIATAQDVVIKLRPVNAHQVHFKVWSMPGLLSTTQERWHSEQTLTGPEWLPGQLVFGRFQYTTELACDFTGGRVETCLVEAIGTIYGFHHFTPLSVLGMD
jgi:hypothetical protein